MNDKEKIDPYEYEGYSYLNKPVLFKGGLPAMMGMGIAGGAMVAFALIATILPNLAGFIGTVIAILILVIALFLVVKWAKTIAIENQKGDKNYLLSKSTFDRSTKQVRDDGLFIKIKENKNEFNF